MTPLVSVIIPAYNRAELICETLESIAAQTYRHWECIIVDDGSQDDTYAIATQFQGRDSRFRAFRRPEQILKGANNSRNFGLEQASGNFILFFDSDDVMHPDKIQKQVDCLIKDRQIAFCVDRFSNYRPDLDQVPEVAFEMNLEGVSLRRYLVGKAYWGTINFMGRRELFNRARFHEKLKSGQEFYFFASVHVNNPRAQGLFLNQSLCMRRIHENSIQQMQKSRSQNRFQNKFAVYWKVYRDFGRKLEPTVNRFLIKSAVVFYHKLLLSGKKIIPLRKVYREILRNFGVLKAVVSALVLLLGRLSGKGDKWGSGMLNRYLK